MEEYEYEIVFNKGASNTNADELNRVSSLVADDGVTEEKRQQLIDEETKVIFNVLLTCIVIILTIKTNIIHYLLSIYFNN